MTTVATRTSDLQKEMSRKIDSGEITLHQMTWFLGLTKQKRDGLCERGSILRESLTSPILRLVSGSHNLILPVTDGAEIISNARDLFTKGIDSKFSDWNLNKPSGPTARVSVSVYEMINIAAFEQIFDSFDVLRQILCLTQSQIIAFVKNFRHWLRVGGHGTFFLFQSEGEFFVADVRFDSSSLRVGVYDLANGFAWNSGFQHRVVVLNPYEIETP